jgi:hypothetical protein
VMFGTLTGSMLPFILQRTGSTWASASAPVVAALVDVAGLAIYSPLLPSHRGNAAVDGSGKDYSGVSAVGDHKSPVRLSEGAGPAGSTITAGGHPLADTARQPLSFRRVVR